MVVLLLWVEFCTYIRGFDGVGGRRIDYIIASRFEWMSRFHMTYVNRASWSEGRKGVYRRKKAIVFLVSDSEGQRHAAAAIALRAACSGILNN